MNVNRYIRKNNESAVFVAKIKALLKIISSTPAVQYCPFLKYSRYNLEPIFNYSKALLMTDFGIDQNTTTICNSAI